DTAELDKVQRFGFRCFEWVRFEESPCGSHNADWRGAADALREETKRRDLRISAIAAWYRNTLDPRQMDTARRVLERAIDVASHLGIRTIGAFAGALTETTVDERGGGPVYSLAEKSIPAAVNFWRPLAQRARDAGVRIAFEHCPQ